MSTSPDVTRYAIFGGPDSSENLSGWLFTELEEAERARPEYGRGATIAILPDSAMAERLAAIPEPVCEVVAPA